MKYLNTILIVATQWCLAQTSVSPSEVYKNGNLWYLKSDNSIFSGKIQNFHNDEKTRIKWSDSIINGHKLKTTFYFNRKKNTPHYEWYFDENGKEIQQVKLSYSKDKREIKKYDQNGDMTLVEKVRDGKLIYSCEYKDKRKHGKLFEVGNDGSVSECFYDRGKCLK